MNWQLFGVAVGIWILFGVHFIFAARIGRMAEAGLVEDGGPVLMASKILCQLALLNLIVFAVVYGIYVSWWQAAAILFGGYVASALYVLLTRGSVYDSLLNPTHKLGWVGLPALSIALWVLAF
ncbi:MAG: hypothetical protein H7A20_13470 [Rhodanobacteraceae bacterium]|nr:hypothetical protein [Rhodanobacteraceae bacterium]